MLGFDIVHRVVTLEEFVVVVSSCPPARQRAHKEKRSNCQVGREFNKVRVDASYV